MCTTTGWARRSTTSRPATGTTRLQCRQVGAPGWCALVSIPHGRDHVTQHAPTRRPCLYVSPAMPSKPGLVSAPHAAVSRLVSPGLALSDYSQHSYWLSLCTRGFVLPRPAMPRARFQRRRSSKYDRLGGRENVVPPGTVCACDCRATRTPSTTWRRCTALARAGPSTSWRPSSGIDFAPSRAALGPCTSTREPVNMAAPSLP